MILITVTIVLLSSVLLNTVYATDALIKEPEPIRRPVQSDQHIAWHDFQHKLTSYPRVNASMAHDGVITLRGFVMSPLDSEKLGELASRVTGATKVVDRTGTK